MRDDNARPFYTLGSAGRTYFWFKASAVSHCERNGLNTVYHVDGRTVWDRSAEVWEANRKAVLTSHYR